MIDISLFQVVNHEIIFFLKRSFKKDTHAFIFVRPGEQLKSNNIFLASLFAV